MIELFQVKTVMPALPGLEDVRSLVHHSSKETSTIVFPAAIAVYRWRASTICATTTHFPTGGLISPGDGG